MKLSPYVTKSHESFRPGASALVKRYHGESGSDMVQVLTDALFLRQALDWQAQLPEGDRVMMVAADQRLLRAAEVEGLAALDPEQSDLAGVKLFLAAA